MQYIFREKYRTAEYNCVNNWENENMTRLVIPYKSQKSADIDISNLGKVIGKNIKPVCVVCKFKCDLCDVTDYVSYTCRHLHQRIDEDKGSVIGQHMKESHGEDAVRIESCFTILKIKSVEENLNVYCSKCSLSETLNHHWTNNRTLDTC